ncbi:MAG: oligosaccharide flippase family protein [bacterium]|nr:oligosaccharide flippase family protein [bacterium]
MSLLKKLAGETAIYGTSSILSRLLHFVILTPFLTYYFTKQEYGVVTDLYAWAALLLVIFTYRMETAFFRFGSKESDMERSFSTAAISLLASTAVLTILFLVFAPEIARWLHYPDHPEYVRWFALIIAFDALAAIPFARLRLENRPIRFAVIKTLNILVNIFFIFFFLKICPWLLEQGYEWAGWLYNPEREIGYVFLSNLLASGSVLLFLAPLLLKAQWTFEAGLWKRMLRYAAPLIVVGVAGIVNQFVGIPLLKELASDDMDYNIAQVGLYGAAAKLAVLMNLFTQAFNYAAEPFFFRNAAREDKSTLYAQVGQGFTLVGCLAFVGIMLYMDIIQYYLGADLRGGLAVVPFLLMAYLFLGLYYNFSIWYKLADRTIIGGYIATAGSVITIGLNVWLIPRYGYLAPGLAALACYSFMAAASYLTGQRYYPIHYPVGRMALYILGAITAYALSLLLQKSYAPGLAAGLALNTVLLLGYLSFLAVLERQGLKRALKQLRKR